MINFLKKFFSKKNISKFGVCSICDIDFPEKMLNVLDQVSLCPSDLLIFKASNWVLVKSNTSNPDRPEQALELQHLKDMLKSHKIPSYITVSYQQTNLGIDSTFKLYISELDLASFNHL